MLYKFSQEKKYVLVYLRTSFHLDMFYNLFLNDEFIYVIISNYITPMECHITVYQRIT